MSVYICGAHILIIVNHAPPPESYFSLLSIVNHRSFPHPLNVGARYNLYVQMCTLGYCVEKHRCHSCGAHGNGKTLLAQVLPCGMTKVFVKLAKIVARNEHFQRSFYKTCLHFTKAHRQKASQLHVLTDHKQLGCLSCDASKVGCLGLPRSVPW